MKQTSTRHYWMLLAVFLLWGIAGAIAGPDDHDLDDSLTAQPPALRPTISVVGLEGEVHLVCRAADLVLDEIPAADVTLRPKAALISYAAVVDPRERHAQVSTRSLTCFIKPN